MNGQTINILLSHQILIFLHFIILIFNPSKSKVQLIFSQIMIFKPKPVLNLTNIILIVIFLFFSYSKCSNQPNEHISTPTNNKPTQTKPPFINITQQNITTTKPSISSQINQNTPSNSNSKFPDKIQISQQLSLQKSPEIQLSAVKSTLRKKHHIVRLLSDCPVQNCKECNSDGVSCDTCEDNYQLSQDKKSCYELCSESMLNFCKYCPNKSQCIQCQENYVLDQFQCFDPDNLPPGCRSADKIGGQTRSHCTDCFQGYTLNTTDDTCKKCQPQNCDQCALSSLDKCTKCLSTFYLSSQGQQCLPCRQNCARCTSSNTCQQCLSNFILYQSQYCGQCGVQNCKSCEFDSATQSHRCKECFESGTYFLMNNQCLKRSEEASGNGIVVYGKGLASYLFSCDFGCDQCYFQKTSIKCSQCSQGYAINTFSGMEFCMKCHPTCKTCQDNHLSLCQSCHPGYTLTFSFECVKCQVDSCHSCQQSDPSICLVCSDQFYPSSDKKQCLYCPDGCSQCSQASQNNPTCANCIDGYHLIGLDNGIMACFPCLQGCSDCEVWNGKCTTCFPRYYLNENKTCSKCKSHCIQCYSDQDCVQCINGKVLVNNSLCVEPHDHCKTYNKEGLCTQCLIGYKLENSACSYEYFSSEEKNMFSCSSNAYLYSYQCYLCQNSIQNCLSCQSFYCIRCQQGYYLSSSGLQCLKCSSAITECSQCQSALTCLTCSQGYYLKTDITKYWRRPIETKLDQFVTYGSQCLKCSDNCLTCEIRDTMCLQCKQGYYLTEGRKCVTKNKFKFSIKVDQTYEDFYKRVMDFKVELVLLIVDDDSISLCVRKKFIMITSVTKGSTVVQGYATASTPTYLEQTYKNFQSVLTASTVLPNNFKILSTTVSDVETEQPQTTTPNSTNTDSNTNTDTNTETNTNTDTNNATTTNQTTDTNKNKNTNTTNPTSNISEQSTSSSSLPAIIGAIVGVIVLLIIGVLVFYFCYYRHKRSEDLIEFQEKKSSSTGDQNNENDLPRKSDKSMKHFNQDQLNQNSDKYISALSDAAKQGQKNWISPQIYL